MGHLGCDWCPDGPNFCGFQPSPGFNQLRPTSDSQLHLLEFHKLGEPPLGGQMDGAHVGLVGKSSTVMGALRWGSCGKNSLWVEKGCC